MSTGFRGNRAGSYQQTSFPANRAVITNSEGRIDFSPVTSGEVGYLANARSNIQEQIDGISSDANINSFNIGSTPFVSESTLPYIFYNGSAVVYNNEIHILGSIESGNYTKHYKWNGSSWTNVSILPYDFYYGSAVVYNNEIHILGGFNERTKHYKWNGSTWTEVSILPYYFYEGAAVVLNNEIHILKDTEHYKWNGSTWTSVSTLPYNFYQGSAVVYNNEIHILGGEGNNYTKHYKWDGTSWSSVSTLPYTFTVGSAVVFNNEIHILGGNGNSTKHYKWNGSTWSNVSTLPYRFYAGSAVVFNNEIHLLDSYNKRFYSSSLEHYSYKATRWSSNPDSTTSTDYPYIYEIQRNLFTDDSKPIWQVEGVGDIPTSTETTEANKIACAYFDDTGITLYATEKPNCDLVLRVKGV